MIISDQYMAGVADSDGSFTITERHKTRLSKNYHCSFQLTWKETELTHQVMDFLVKTYGGSYFKCTKQNTTLGQVCDVIKYYLQGKELESFMDAVEPHLILKKKQVEIIRQIRALSPLGRYGKHNPKPQEIKDKEAELLKIHRTLNTKNRRK